MLMLIHDLSRILGEEDGKFAIVWEEMIHPHRCLCFSAHRVYDRDL